MMLRLRRAHGGPTLTGLSISSHRPWKTVDGLVAAVGGSELGI
jgi:hypothetical protein